MCNVPVFLSMRNFDFSIIVPCYLINRSFIELISSFLIEKNKIEKKNPIQMEMVKLLLLRYLLICFFLFFFIFLSSLSLI